MEVYLKEYIAMWKNWSDFGGKADLKDFWMAILVNFLISIVLSLVFGIVGLDFVYYLYSLAAFIPMIAIGFRRFHDIGKSGLNYLWIFALLPGWIYMIYLWIQPSK